MRAVCAPASQCRARLTRGRWRAGDTAGGAATSAAQRDRLLSANDKLKQTGDRIKEGKKTLLETEELGVSILQDLHKQRETIVHTRETVRLSRRADPTRFGAAAVADASPCADAALTHHALTHIDAPRSCTARMTTLARAGASWRRWRSARCRTR